MFATADEASNPDKRAIGDYYYMGERDSDSCRTSCPARLIHERSRRDEQAAETGHW